jgi:hypothetical protein
MVTTKTNKSMSLASPWLSAFMVRDILSPRKIALRAFVLCIVSIQRTAEA